MPFHTYRVVFVLGAAGLFASGCTSDPDRLAQSLTSGERVVMHLSAGPDGTLEATAIDVEADEDEGEDVEADEDEGEDHDGVEDEGEGEDDDGIECEQEGEHEGENEGCDAPAAMIVAPLDRVTAADQIDVLGIHVSLQGAEATLEPGTSLKGAEATLEPGTYWFGGDYRGNNRFDGSVIKVSANDRLRILGTLEQVSVHGDGSVSVQLLDRSVRVAPDLILNQVGSIEEAAESDIDCEQEGEHEGENEGC